jgi:FtsP/CotA-like multicopper oxidase with cupredoxin domain
MVGEQTIEGYGYNGQVPGPTIFAKLGDRVIVDFINGLDMGTTVHWHGLHVPFEMDGVTWQGAPIAPGELYRYEFVLNQHGTYWYHPHFDTERTLDLGLYGGLLVEEPDVPEVTEDIVLIFDQWSENESKETVFDHRDVDGAIRTWTVNGAIEPSFSVESGSVVRARLINVANGGYLRLRWPEMVLIGGDQGRLQAADEVSELVLAPGDRAETIWRLGSEGFAIESHPYTMLGGAAYGESTVLAIIDTLGDSPKPAMPGINFSGDPPTEQSSHVDIVYVLQGNSSTGYWLINGEVFPEVTIEELVFGADTIIEVRNVSSSEHPFHLHGHSFEVVSRNGVSPAYRQVEDTINVSLYETVVLRLIASNPGDWMVHCHIQAHQYGGMMTVLRVNGE